MSPWPHLLLAVLVGFTGISCSGDETEARQDAATRSAFESEEEMLAWAGFGDTTEVEVVTVEEETGIDTAVTFVLRGDPAEIDDVLVSAGVESRFQGGVPAGAGFPAEFEEGSLTNLRSASDTLMEDDGSLVHRVMTRGSLDGTELLHVQAFTT